MQLNSKVTWGLAWAGLALVLAVPSADFLTGNIGGGKAALLTSTTDPVATDTVKKTATVTTTRTATGIKIIPAGATDSTDPVDTLLKNGKALPDYISGGTATADATGDTTTTKVASIDPAPTPFPSWARPKAIVPGAAPMQLPLVVTGGAPAEPTVIVDETTTGGITTLDTSRPVPPAAIPGDGQNWDDESLARYLDNRGLLDDGRSSATVTTRATADGYDPDGFYLSDGPNGDAAAARRRARLDELFADDATDNSDTADFTLF